MVVFVAWACLAAALVSKIELGLDQQLSMPQVIWQIQTVFMYDIACITSIKHQ